MKIFEINLSLFSNYNVQGFECTPLLTRFFGTWRTILHSTKVRKRNFFTSKVLFLSKLHSWAKFKIISLRKPPRKFYYQKCQKCQKNICNWKWVQLPSPSVLCMHRQKIQVLSAYGGFHLLILIISVEILFVKKILYKICSPVSML